MNELVIICLYASEEEFFQYLAIKTAEHKSNQHTKTLAEKAGAIAKKYGQQSNFNW